MSQSLAPVFTPIETLIGGYLLHLSTVSLLEDTGTVFGASGIVDGAVWGSPSDTSSGKGLATKPDSARVHTNGDAISNRLPAQAGAERYWRPAVIAGMLLAPKTASLLGVKGAVGSATSSGWHTLSSTAGPVRLAIAGLLVGLGSRLGSGCTSGHFLCGASRLSRRSIIATATFFPLAMITSVVLPLSEQALSLPSDLPAYVPRLPTSSSLTPLVLPVLITTVFRSVILRLRPLKGPYRLLPFVLAGWTFGMGLVISGMANPLKVLAFARLSPLDRWDPSLAMVFLGGVVPNALSYRRLMSHWSVKGSTPKPAHGWAKWTVPTKRNIDWRLVGGAAMFGVGWGLAGVCPGPAIVGVADAVRSSLPSPLSLLTESGVPIFASAMLLGMRIARLVL